MNRKIAVTVIEEIMDACKDSANIGGYSLNPLRRRKGEVGEIVIIATLDTDSRKAVKTIVSRYGLEIAEAKGRLTIWKASEKGVIYL